MALTTSLSAVTVSMRSSASVSSSVVGFRTVNATAAKCSLTAVTCRPTALSGTSDRATIEATWLVSCSSSCVPRSRNAWSATPSLETLVAHSMMAIVCLLNADRCCANLSLYLATRMDAVLYATRGLGGDAGGTLAGAGELGVDGPDGRVGLEGAGVVVALALGLTPLTAVITEGRSSSGGRAECRIWRVVPSLVSSRRPNLDKLAASASSVSDTLRTWLSGSA